VFRDFNIPTTVKGTLWNGGGSGIDNTNFSDNYATMEFFGNDSVKMCIIDEFLQVLACMTITSEKTTSTGAEIQAEKPFLLLYPNPSKDILKVKFHQAIEKEGVGSIFSTEGKEVLSSQTLYPGSQIFQFNIDALSPGVY